MSPAPLFAGDLPRDFADALAARADRLRGFAAPVVWYDTVSSTNDLADRAAAAGAGHGTVVAAVVLKKLILRPETWMVEDPSI